MGIVLYFSTVSSNQEIKKHQQRIEMILDGKKIQYEKVDISANTDEKTRMREIAGDPKALPPQIANGDQYCGDYQQFETAVEDETLEEFLKLK
ncbi:SH3 domain-binding glutamic acid-rich-like protein 3 [Tubulanus polymorphus]|uniref:SH3 domain-binding glutamic acid-rich-like protein 3 n=1 Tax=Tubulanus polymorphus TaxID=672921 RepID=UPI003DA6CC14